MVFYKLLILVHIFSAIVGMGPGFALVYIVKSANTMSELRHAYVIRSRLHIFVMIGGTLLLITGLLMGLLNPSLFHMGWYVISLILFLIGMAMGPLVLARKSRPVKALLESYEGDDIPEEYTHLSSQLFKYEWIENMILLIIIFLMALKPF
jgi:Na+-translocating ferredoxin:NAD+ oxidoreductase RnfE subunit